MKNVAMKLDGNRLNIQIDLSQTLGISRSGKSTMIATTEGNAKVPGAEDLTVGLNVFRKNGKA